MKNTYKYIILTCGAALILAAGFGAYKYNEHVKYENSVKENIASVKTVSGKYVAEKDDNKKFEDLKKLQKELKDYQNGNENDERVVKEYNKSINTLVKYFKDKNDKVLKDNTYDSSKETNKDVLQQKVNNLNELVKVVEGQKDVVYSTTLKEVKKVDKVNSIKESKEGNNKETDKKADKKSNDNKAKVVSAEEKVENKKAEKKDAQKVKQNKQEKQEKSEFDTYVEKIKTIINGYNSKLNQIKEEEKRKAEEEAKRKEEAKRQAEEQKAREEGKVAFNANGQYVGEGSPEAVYNASGQTQQQVQAQSQYQNSYDNSYNNNYNNYNNYNSGSASSGNAGGSYTSNNGASTGGSASNSNGNDKGEYIGWAQLDGGEKVERYYKDGAISNYDNSGNYLGKMYQDGQYTIIDVR